MRQVQVFWTKLKKTSYEAQVDECGKENLYVGNGYEYEVTKPAVLHIVTQGTGTFTVNQTTYPLKKGDVFLLLKGMHVKYQATGDTPWHYMWVGFSGTHAINFITRTSLSDEYVLVNQNTDTLFKLIFKICILANSHTSEDTHDILLKIRLFELLYFLTQQNQKEIIIPNQREATDLKEALEYFNENFRNRETTVDNAARIAKMSRSQLYKRLKKQFSASPSRYLMDLRMAYAAEQLKFTNKSVETISCELHFSDSLGFSKSFSKYFNTPPSHYRKMYKARKNATD
ncbi:AraC family transcriptional regulator [Staphylococcus simulans]|uniref:AraC family transcriptional regulator n=1 Tax=Staphylococcus simulans TaxID=1286 RepID=UPI00399B570A